MNFAFPPPAIDTAIERSAVNSSAFYFSSAAPRDWTAPQNGALWQDRVKTLFDPCPAGWRVPRGGEEMKSIWSGFVLNQIVWNGDNTSQATNGCSFNLTTIGDGTFWYPACGDRESLGFNHTGNLGFLWTSTASAIGAYDLYCGLNTLIYANANAQRSAGLPVRCVRE